MRSYKTQAYWVLARKFLKLSSFTLFYLFMGVAYFPNTILYQAN